VECLVSAIHSGESLSGEYGTHKTVKARFWPWLESGLGFSANVLNCFQLVPFLLESGF